MSNTNEGSAALAEAVLGNQAAAFFCDGRNVESCFGGTDDGADITVKSKSATLQAGRPLSSTRSKTTIGWIVLEDGSQVGVQTTGTGLAAALQLDPENPQSLLRARTSVPSW